MNVKILFSSLIICLLLFISSCTTTGISRSSTGGGSNGVEISFVSNAPPSQIYVEKGSNRIPFEVLVDINNRGDYPSNDAGSLGGRLYLTGFDKNIIEGFWNGGNEFNKIIGASDSMPEGGSEQKSYIADTIHFPFDSKSYDLSLMLTACYYYQTYTAGMVCIDPNPTSVSQNDKVCQMGSVKLSSQNSPVKVTGISQTGNSNEAIFTISLSNVGTGDVISQFSPNNGVISDDRCLDVGFNDKDRVTLRAVVPGLGEATCTPAGTPIEPIRLNSGSAKVICKLPLDNRIETAYTAQLEVTLSYGYLVSTMTDVTLINTAAR